MPDLPHPPLSQAAAALSGNAPVGTASSPFVGSDQLVAGGRLSTPFPPADWSARMVRYADGSKSSRLVKGHHEKKILEMKRDFARALASVEGHDALAAEVQRHLGAGYKSNKETAAALGNPPEPEKAQILQGTLVAAALAHAFNDPDSLESKKVLSQVMNSLNTQEQSLLLRGDAAGSKKLYSAAYEAAQNSDDHKPLFARLKPVAQMASVHRRLDELDPTGQASQTLSAFTQHLKNNEVPDADINIFADKMAFKMVLQKEQGAYPDIPVPRPGREGWQDDMTAAYARTFAESRVSDESVLKMLNTNPQGTLKLLAHAATGSTLDLEHTHQQRREGDFRILKTFQEQASLNRGQPGWDRLDSMVRGLEKGTLDRNLCLAQAQSNAPILEASTRLNEERAQFEAGLAASLNTRMANIQTGLTAHATNLDHNLTAKPMKRQDKADYLADKPGFKEVSDNPDTIQRNLNAIRNFQTSNPAPPTFTPAEATALLERYGRGPLKPLTISAPVNASNMSAGLQGQMRQMEQAGIQLAAIRDPSTLERGLERSALVLPTAGRDLKDCAWVESTARDLAQTAHAIRGSNDQFTLARHPIIIIDQTDGDGQNQAKLDKFASNRQYLDSLEQKYADVGLKFQHVSMQQVNAMTLGADSRKLFDTTGEGIAGFGGSRNMAFLLGPVIQAAVREGRDLGTITPANLERQIAEHAMSKEAPKIFMGDDTDYICTGMTASIAALAGSESQGTKYTLHPASRGGRDTQSVAPAAANQAGDQLATGGYDATVSKLFSVNKWEGGKMTTPGMGCTFGNPRFCLDLPTGKEETHHDAALTSANQFGVSFHLSGDRQNSPSEQLKNNMAYTNLTAALGKLWDNKNQLGWNVEAKNLQKAGQPPESLGDVMTLAAKPEHQANLQQAFFNNLVDWRAAASPNDGILGLSDPKIVANIDSYLKSGAVIDAEERAELVKMRGVYLDGQTQSERVKELVDRTFKNLAQDANNTGRLPGNSTPDKAQLKSLDLRGFGAAVEKAKTDMGIPLSQTENRMVRDVALIMQSVGDGGFHRLATRLDTENQALKHEQVFQQAANELGAIDLNDDLDIPQNVNVEVNVPVLEEQAAKLEQQEKLFQDAAAELNAIEYDPGPDLQAPKPEAIKNDATTTPKLVKTESVRDFLSAHRTSQSDKRLMPQQPQADIEPLNPADFPPDKDLENAKVDQAVLEGPKQDDPKTVVRDKVLSRSKSLPNLSSDSPGVTRSV